MSRIAFALLFCATCTLAQQIPPTHVPQLKLEWNRFYDYGAMTEALKLMEAGSSGWMKLSSLGTSVEGREMWLATINDPAGSAAETKPAMWIDANIHGNEIQGTEACLYTLWYLLENRERLPRVRELLARAAFYVLPSMNPDGREFWFHDANTASSSRSGKGATDNDRDGLLDEDGPDDLDGDGSITQMRMCVASGGTHIIDPDDVRLMKRVKPGVQGTHIMLGQEGIDNDGDGAVNEDGPGGYDMNRNWPSDWQPDWLQGGAGPYPFCWPETRCVGDFLRAHPNIAALQSYHNNGGMILRGPGAETIPEYPSQDVAVYDELGKAGEKMLPHYRYMIIWKDLYQVHGGSITWAFENLGIFGFTNELWADAQYGGGSAGDQENSQKSRLEWDERMELGKNLRPWTAIKHPKHGDIEVGGFAKTSSRVPPPFMLEELCHRNMAFTLYHAAEMPHLEVPMLSVTKAGAGLWKVRAEVHNKKLIPTIAALARKRAVVRPDLATLEGELKVLAGGIISGPVHDEQLERQEHRAERLQVPGGVAGHGRVILEWWVSTADGSAPRGRFTYDALKGGRVSETLPGS
ncbi:MAG: peptidase M14 [Planctomycetes bacterium]|nr:peptidase M14 [Planctomycetota bacterium]